MVLPRGTRESGHCARIDSSTPKPSPFPPETWLAVETWAYGCGCNLQPALGGDFHTGAIIILNSLNCLPVAYFLGPCLSPDAEVQPCSLKSMLSLLSHWPFACWQHLPITILAHLAPSSPVPRRYRLHPHARDKIRLLLKASSFSLKQLSSTGRKASVLFLPG